MNKADKIQFSAWDNIQAGLTIVHASNGWAVIDDGPGEVWVAPSEQVRKAIALLSGRSADESDESKHNDYSDFCSACSAIDLPAVGHPDSARINAALIEAGYDGLVAAEA